MRQSRFEHESLKEKREVMSNYCLLMGLYRFCLRPVDKEHFIEMIKTPTGAPAIQMDRKVDVSSLKNSTQTDRVGYLGLR